LTWDEEVKDHKRRLRRLIGEAREALSPAQIEAQSEAIAQRLWAEPVYRQARVGMFYVSFRSEVRTWQLLRRALAEGKRVVVPISRLKDFRLDLSEVRDPDRELVPGTYGVPEPRPEFVRPVDPDELDLIVLPGVAFDERGGRIGHGAGFYDRFLKRVPADVPRIALAFEVQLVDEVPMKPYDMPVSLILTEARRIECQAVRNPKSEIRNPQEAGGSTDGSGPPPPAHCLLPTDHHHA